MPVDCAKGALVVWDNRLPHATASKFQSADTRECVYVGFLPDVPSNRRYVAEQRAAIIANRAPPAYAADNVGSSVDRDWDVDNDLTTEQRRLLMLD
jgi:ectoine hydroxylase-related dioxygenase (phytanoyl-CoA dioxygenase family)